MLSQTDEAEALRWRKSLSYNLTLIITATDQYSSARDSPTRNGKALKAVLSKYSLLLFHKQSSYFSTHLLLHATCHRQSYFCTHHSCSSARASSSHSSAAHMSIPTDAYTTVKRVYMLRLAHSDP